MISKKLLRCLVITLVFVLACGKNEKSNEYSEEDVKKTTQEVPKNTQQKTDQNLDTTQKNTADEKPLNNRQYKDNFQNEKPVAVISPVEAADYNGKTVTVKGFVADVYKSDKVAYLNFVEKYPNNPFTAVIFASKFEDFPDIAKYKNKDVDVTGRVSFFKGKPQIILNSPSQIKVN